jgi:hypothetical protein
MTESEIEAYLEEIGDPATTGERRYTLIMEVFARGYNKCADDFGPDIPHIMPIIR